jgi:hypothetical protein
VKRRESEAPEFLERPAAWWAQHKPSLHSAGMVLLPFAGMVLAGMGQLRPDEAERLRRVAAGLERHPRLPADAAGRILARVRRPA